MSNEREELAWNIFSIDNAAIPDKELRKDFPHEADYAFHIAEGLIEAGYRRPRQVTTVEELDALPDGSAVLDSHGDVSTKHAHWWHGYETAPLLSRKVAKYGPLTVLHIGGTNG